MTNKHVDAVALDELRNIMGDEFNLLIEVFVKDSTDRLVVIEKAIASGDAEDLRGCAHGFKGSALNISATLLTDLCKQLEYMGRDSQLDGAAEVFEALKIEFAEVKSYFDTL